MAHAKFGDVPTPISIPRAAIMDCKVRGVSAGTPVSPVLVGRAQTIVFRGIFVHRQACPVVYSCTDSRVPDHIRAQATVSRSIFVHRQPCLVVGSCTDNCVPRCVRAQASVSRGFSCTGKCVSKNLQKSSCILASCINHTAVESRLWTKGSFALRTSTAFGNPYCKEGLLGQKLAGDGPFVF